MRLLSLPASLLLLVPNSACALRPSKSPTIPDRIETKPDSSVEDVVEAFVHGDEGAREGLLKTGVRAIDLLRAARGRTPQRVDELLWEIKKAAAGPDARAAIDALESGMAYGRWPPRQTRETVTRVSNLGPLPIPDPILPSEDIEATLGLGAKEGHAREVLDAFCRDRGFDYP